MDIHTAIETLESLQGKGVNLEVKVKGKDMRSHGLLMREMYGTPIHVDKGDEEARIVVDDEDAELRVGRDEVLVQLEGVRKPIGLPFTVSSVEKHENNGVTVFTVS